MRCGRRCCCCCFATFLQHARRSRGSCMSDGRCGIAHLPAVSASSIILSSKRGASLLLRFKRARTCTCCMCAARMLHLCVCVCMYMCMCVCMLYLPLSLSLYACCMYACGHVHVHVHTLCTPSFAQSPVCRPADTPAAAPDTAPFTAAFPRFTAEPKFTENTMGWLATLRDVAFFVLVRCFLRLHSRVLSRSYRSRCLYTTTTTLFLLGPSILDV